MYFRNYRHQKTCLDKCLKSRVSEDLWKGSMVNRSKHCCNLNDSTFAVFVDHSEGKLSWKKSRLVILKILRLFLNTLTADDKYSLINRDTLTQPIWMQLSQKEKIALNFFLHF